MIQRRNDLRQSYNNWCQVYTREFPHGKNMNYNQYQYQCFQYRLHRVDGPAVECIDGTKEWYVNGYLHRIDGPAIEGPNYPIQPDDSIWAIKEHYKGELQDWLDDQGLNMCNLHQKKYHLAFKMAFAYRD